MAKFNKPKKDKFADIFPPFEVVDENGNVTKVNLGEILDEAEAAADYEYDEYNDEWLDDDFYDDPWVDDVPVIDHEAAAKEQAIRELEDLAKRFPKSEDE